MAEVFKAKSYGVEGFEKIIAIKRILPTMGEDRDFIKMFIDEAKIAGQLAHANICQIFELGRIDGSHFIAMEYIWGKDLLQIQNRLRKIKQPMPIPMACFAIAKVLEGLDYAHRKRDPLGRPLEIVHRDCSPQNVLVSYEGEVKVIDFGIAKATSRNSRTMAGVLKGKFGYMSPEQVRGLPLDRRSDLFALGTMLYECLTSERLFQGETDFSTLEKVRNVDVRPPREINPNIPPAVEAVIMKALAKDVEERYQWCSEMLADLQAFLMSQDAVFTAKSLSSWLKEVFAGEIDRERQQLEQYKRVGRDGLIDGMPAAEARSDIVAVLGEAPPVEGDPTVLGTPNFDDIEQAAGASPEVGPAPGSPATRAASESEEGEDFGEEAPTEIFGEIDHGGNPALAAAAAMAAMGRPPGGAPPPITRPPKPPPASRAPTSRGDAPPGVAGNGAGSAGRTPAPEMGFAPPGGAWIGSPAGSPFGAGAPGMMPVGPSNGAPVNPGPGQGPGQGKTLIGAMAPPGLSSYLNSPAAMGAPHAGPSAQQGHAMGPMGAMGPPGPMGPMGPMGAMGGAAPMSQHMRPGQAPGSSISPPGMPMMGSGPFGPPGQPMMPMAMHPSQMQGFPGAPPPYMSQAPYGASNPYAPVPPIEQMVHPEGKRRSSIARDVAIGVAIAALVLGGFLAVKYLMLDSDSAAVEPAAPAPAYARVRAVLSGGDAANLYLDDKLHATVRNGQDIDVQPGQRKIKLLGPSGVCFEQEMKLVAGQVATLSCALGPAAGSSATPSGAPTGSSAAGSGSAGGSDAAGSGSAVAAGSAAPPATGSGAAPPATGSGASGAPTTGSASTGGGPAAGAAASEHPAPDRADRMPVEDTGKPAATERPASPTHRPVERPAERRSARPAPPADDDLGLGKLQGGVKPGERKPDARKH